MPSDAQILEAVSQAFVSCERPIHFTDHTHCSECADHDEVLRSHNVSTLAMAEIGNPGWDPICFISPPGFAYYLPALARLALAEPDQKQGWYGPQLMFHLCLDGARNERVLACTPVQRRAVVGLLHHIFETRGEQLHDYMCGDELFHAIEYWSEDSHPCENDATGN
jgi:hypothetical protein